MGNVTTKTMSFRPMTTKFKVELIDSIERTDDYIVNVLVTDKSSGRTDIYSFSSYWSKAEPYSGVFNNIDIANKGIEFHIWIGEYIKHKYSKDINEGIEFILNGKSKLDTFINSI